MVKCPQSGNEITNTPEDIHLKHTHTLHFMNILIFMKQVTTKGHPNYQRLFGSEGLPVLIQIYAYACHPIKQTYL
jgi:hypothetical protein